MKDYYDIEKEIVAETKEFATFHNIVFEELHEAMIINALRELKKQIEK